MARPGRPSVFIQTNAMESDTQTSNLSRAITLLEQEIAERKRTEAALRESQEKYQALVEASTDAIFLETLDGQILDCNTSACEMYGYSKDELTALTVADLVPEEIAEKLPEIIQEELESGGVFIEATNRRKNGQVFPCEVSTQLIHIGGEQRAIVYVRDITERKQTEAARLQEKEAKARARAAEAARQTLEKEIAERARAEEALHSSEQQYRSILETAMDGFLLLDNQGGFLDVNDAYCHMTGYDRTELLNMSIQDVEALETSQQTAKHLQRVVTHGWDRFETRHMSKDGALIDLEVSVNYQAELGEKFICFLRDITERKRSERTLEQRANQLALLNAIGREIVAMLDLDKILQKTAHLVQQRFGYHHVGLFTVDRLNNQLVMRAKAGSYAHLLPEDHRLKFDQGMVGWAGYSGELLLANNVQAEPHYLNIYPDLIPTRAELAVPILVGEEIVGVLDVQSPREDAFDENDVLVIQTLADQVAVAIENARLYQAIHEELSERKRLEQYMLRAERLVAMGNTAAVLAHEIKNPLQSLQSNIELVLDYALEPVEREEHLHLCYLELERLIDLTNRLLSLARFDRVDCRSACVDDLVQRTLALVASHLHKAGVQVTTDLREGLPLVWVVPEQITEVLLNLIVNAIEAMPGGGDVHIKTDGNAEQVTLSVINYGGTIPQEHIEHIFDPFYTTKPGGTGLGLSISQNILQYQGGTLTVENLHEENGVKFSVTLPTSDFETAPGAAK